MNVEAYDYLRRWPTLLSLETNPFEFKVLFFHSAFESCVLLVQDAVFEVTILPVAEPGWPAPAA